MMPSEPHPLAMMLAKALRDRLYIPDGNMRDVAQITESVIPVGEIRDVIKAGRDCLASEGFDEDVERADAILAKLEARP